MSKILVTGGLGFIGSHTVVELQQEGYEVVAVDNLSNSDKDVVNGIAAITGTPPIFENVDIRSRSEVQAMLQRHSDAEGVIHFAAYKAVGESVENPLKYYENNIAALVVLLQELDKTSIKNFIFSSSCTVYGQAEKLPITEDAPVVPANSPYGNTKQVGEEILEQSVAAHDFKVISLRYFNPIGAHPSAHIGELPTGVILNLVPYVTQTAAGVREQLSVYGNDYDTPDGTCIRDYIHVVDLAKAHVIAVQRLLNATNDNPFEVFNLGTGKGSSVLEVIASFEKISGESLNYKIVDRRPGDVRAAYADTHKANKVLGWKAKKTLDDAMKDAWRWEKKIRNIS